MRRAVRVGLRVERGREHHAAERVGAVSTLAGPRTTSTTRTDDGSTSVSSVAAHLGERVVEPQAVVESSKRCPPRPADQRGGGDAGGALDQAAEAKSRQSATSRMKQAEGVMRVSRY